MSIDEDFAEFVGARWGSLYRLAYLLAASPTGAEDLLQTTLEKAYVNWSRIGRDGVCRGVRAPDARQHPGVEPSAGLDPGAADGRAARGGRGLRRAAGPGPVPALAAGVRAARTGSGR